MASLARLQKDNTEITKQIAGYLAEPRFPIRLSSALALGSRGDASAIPALEALLKSDDLSIAFAPLIKEQIERLKKPKSAKSSDKADDEEEAGEKENAEEGDAAVRQRLDKLEQLIREMNERLKTIETRLPPPKK
jgi:HEAT repeat protein